MRTAKKRGPGMNSACDTAPGPRATASRKASRLPTPASGQLAGLPADGFDPEKHFSRVIFSGAHGANIMAVANGEVAVARLRQGR